MTPSELEIFLYRVLVLSRSSVPSGDPPQAAAWLGQCGVYLLIMVLEKGVISLVLLVPGWSKVRTLYGYLCCFQVPRERWLPVTSSHRRQGGKRLVLWPGRKPGFDYFIVTIRTVLHPKLIFVVNQTTRKNRQILTIIPFVFWLRLVLSFHVDIRQQKEMKVFKNERAEDLKKWLVFCFLNETLKQCYCIWRTVCSPDIGDCICLFQLAHVVDTDPIPRNKRAVYELTPT